MPYLFDVWFVWYSCRCYSDCCLFQFGAALKDNPANAIKSLLGVIILVAVVVIAWAMGSDAYVIPGYEGTDNVYFWLKTD